MKVATFLLSVTVFTTLFLESSTTPVDIDVIVTSDVEATVPVNRAVASIIDFITGEVKEAQAALTKIASTLRRKLQLKAVQKTVTNAFNIANAALDDAIKAVEETLAKAKGGEKVPLTQVLNWLNPLVALSALAESTIDDALAKDTVEDLENAIALLNQSIVETEANLVKYVRILEESPSKLVNSVKAVVKKDINIILAYASFDLPLLKSLVPGAKQGSNAAA